MKIPKSIKLFGILSLVCLMTLSMVSAAADLNVCRDLPTSANPGETITVTLDITLDGADKTVIEDNVPAGWNVSNPSGSGLVVDANTVSWIDVNAALGVEQLTYDVTIPGDAALGTYTFDGMFDLAVAAPGVQPIDCDTQMEVVEVVVEPSSGGSSGTSSGTSSGGSSGGSSGATGETFENIVKKEVKSAYVMNGAKVSYQFNEKENNIDFIKFDALKNSGMISVTIETLKDTSALVKTNPAGKVYQNMNIWVGKAGYATPNDIVNPVIGFRVERSWIGANDIDGSAIKLNRYHDGTWNPLPTTKVQESKDYIYFEAKTPGFSPFAITGETNSVVSEDEGLTGTDTNTSTEGSEDRTTSYKGENRTTSADAKTSIGNITMLLSFATIIGFMGYIKRDDIRKYLKKK
ncbi:PGF-pre-PGF domain-containing protein [Methanococcoides seepicolus]|uniref:PGF-pre-PGF domain-containing protein n=2 Tax=Methanococcoides seepicolus TaxID=2828780 RepID=A0A9E5D9T7_9EURY|nr:PGF-pre-PGF domain-containing protein [Methanococcoides seepicolus]